MHQLSALQEPPIRLTLGHEHIASQACLFYSVDAKSQAEFEGVITNERQNLLDLC